MLDCWSFEGVCQANYSGFHKGRSQVATPTAVNIFPIDSVWGQCFCKPLSILTCGEIGNHIRFRNARICGTQPQDEKIVTRFSSENIITKITDKLVVPLSTKKKVVILSAANKVVTPAASYGVVFESKRIQNELFPLYKRLYNRQFQEKIDIRSNLI